MDLIILNYLLISYTKCDLGFFYYTRFIYLENSHFGVVAAATIFNFIYNFKYYLNKKFLFLLNIIFIIFAFGTFSLSFYLSSLFSIILFIFVLKIYSFID